MSTPQFPVPGGDSPVGPPPSPPPSVPGAVPGAPAPPTVPPAVPPGAYVAPVGGYPAPSEDRIDGYRLPHGDPTQNMAPGSRTTGVIALVLAVVAAVVVPIVAGLVAYRIGALLPDSGISVDSSFADDLAVLTPARTQVLWAEILFWTGTALGIVAIVLGIIATARRRGRGPGIAAIVLSALGPFGFFLAVSVFLGIGAVASAAGGI